MLFLGAGASCAFNLPDLNRITDIIMKNIHHYKSNKKIIELKPLRYSKQSFASSTFSDLDSLNFSQFFKYLNSNMNIQYQQSNTNDKYPRGP